MSELPPQEQPDINARIAALEEKIAKIQEDNDRQQTGIDALDQALGAIRQANIASRTANEAIAGSTEAIALGQKNQAALLFLEKTVSGIRRMVGVGLSFLASAVLVWQANATATNDVVGDDKLTNMYLWAGFAGAIVTLLIGIGQEKLIAELVSRAFNSAIDFFSRRDRRN